MKLRKVKGQITLEWIIIAALAVLVLGSIVYGLVHQAGVTGDHTTDILGRLDLVGTQNYSPFGTREPTWTPVYYPTITLLPTSTITPTRTQTQTSMPTATRTSTPTFTPTYTLTFTPTYTPTNTSTYTPTPTKTYTPTPSNTFTPTATNTFTPTATPTQTSTFTPSPTPSLLGYFGGGLFLDGSGDWITAPDSDAWTLDSGSYTNPFTIEMWVKVNANGITQGLISQFKGSNYFWLLSFQDNGLVRYRIDYNGNTKVYLGWSFTPTIGQWYHIALVKDALGNYTLYVNGTSLGTFNNSYNQVNYDGPLAIGEATNASGTVLEFHGEIDEVRVSKGIARYTANFTPPAAPFTYDSYDVVLLHFDTAGTSVTDDAGNAWTFVGDAVVQ